ncbi:neuropeptide Y receptor type 6-like isoform X2 [Pocillopora verrucosa]|uniref:neuropeptide Y receptor type 6-like isoform X2 n=1 Tax=Pocillopora verrucosa TaxID=203993 RepID=UPI00333E5485
MNDSEDNGVDDRSSLSEEEYVAGYQMYDIFLDAAIAVRLLLAFLGVIANCTVCGVLLRQKRLTKNFSNFHLFNIALTDIVFRVALTPVLATIENTAVEHGNNAVCKLGAFSSYTTLAVTFALLLGMAFDRYVHIVRPIKARKITWKHSRNVVVISWLYAALCSSPILFSMKYTKLDWNLTDSWGPRLIWLCLQAFEVISLEDDYFWEGEEISYESQIEAQKYYIKLLIIDDIIDAFTFTSSILNPVIFGYYSKSFRVDLKKCCCGGKCFNIFQKCKHKAKKPKNFEKKTVRSVEIMKTTEIVLMEEDNTRAVGNNNSLENGAVITEDCLETKL